MTSRISWRGITFPTLAIAGFLAGIAPTTADGSMNINLVERATVEAVLDTGAKGDSAGDVLTFTNDIFDEATRARLAATVAIACAPCRARPGNVYGR